jgi:hypothetical protein
MQIYLAPACSAKADSVPGELDVALSQPCMNAECARWQWLHASPSIDARRADIGSAY